MSKSDLAQAAARHLKEVLVATGRQSEELLSSIAQEYEIESRVLRAWLLRDFESLEALDAWAVTRRMEIARLPELDRLRIAKLHEDLGAEWKAIEAEFAELLIGMREAFRTKYAATEHLHGTVTGRSRANP